MQEFLPKGRPKENVQNSSKIDAHWCVAQWKWPQWEELASSYDFHKLMTTLRWCGPTF
jgi:hypothetical protein